MRTPTWDNPENRGFLLLMSVLFAVIGVEGSTAAGLHLVGIAALLVAPATALNYLYLRAVGRGTVRPVHLWARRVANAGYLAGLVILCLANLWRVNHHGDLGWFWVVLNLVAAVLLALVVVRVVWICLSGRRPDLDSP
jgi:hypothetical protein